MLLLSRVTWRMLIATARVLRLTRPRSSRVRVWLWGSFLGNCSSCTGICYLGNPLNCNVIGYHGSPLSWTVERDFCEVIDLSSWIMITTWRYRCTRIGSWTIRVTMPGIILRRAWVRPKGRHVAGGSIGTKKIPFVKTEREETEERKTVLEMFRLKENSVYRFLQMRYEYI